MKDRIIQLLNDLKIKYRWVDHPAVFTVTDLTSLPEDIKPIKNLLLQENGNGQKFLIVMAGDKRLDLKIVREEFGAKRLNFASDETLLQTFGIKPGAVSVFGLLYEGSNGVEVIVDEEILKDDELGFHPDDNTATILFSTNKLEPILEKMGCSYKIMKLY